MENVVVSSGVQAAISTDERSENQTRGSESAEQASDSYVATIIRMDQSTAERIFRQATR